MQKEYNMRLKEYLVEKFPADNRGRRYEFYYPNDESMSYPRKMNKQEKVKYVNQMIKKYQNKHDKEMFQKWRNEADRLLDIV
jgi:lipoate-protein ligase A